MRKTVTTDNLEITSFCIYNDPILKDRNSRREGVLVYVTEVLHVIHCDDLEFTNGELIWLEICMPRSKILKCAVYRTQGTNI